MVHSELVLLREGPNDTRKIRRCKLAGKTGLTS
jgi:hypothetical protein